MSDPAGSLSLAKKYLMDTLAACAAFQTLVGAGNPAAALAKIYRGALPPPANNADAYSATELAAYRAYALVYTDQETGFRRQRAALGDHVEANESGRFLARLVRTIPSELVDDPDEIDLTFDNAIGQIIDQLLELAGTAGYLNIDEAMIDNGPWINHPDVQPTQGDHQAVELGLRWSAG